TKHQVKVVMKALDMFTKASGLKVNFCKSMFQAYPLAEKECSSWFFQYSLTRDLGRYLDVSIDHDRSSKRTVRKVIEKLQKKLTN
ncbi:hypothetical protein PIB30_006410, partial [Stylosanthes scabra]|nr:hypothetical protein [Stylosanthes scabra]